MAVLDDQITAGRIARAAEIMDIRLFEASSKLVSTDAPGEVLSFDLDVNPVVQHDSGADYFVLRVSYVVTISSESGTSKESSPDSEEDDSENDSGVVARISCDFGALYRLALEQDEAEVRAEELDAYARTAGMMCLHPYAREHVNYVTRNLGLPGLILPIFKLPLMGAPDPGAVDPG